MILIKAVVVVFVLVTGFAYTLLWERKLIGRFQARYGPNRAGPGGLPPAAGRRREADLQGGLRPARGQPLPLPDRADDLGLRRRGGRGGDPVRRPDRDLRPHRQPGGRRPERRRALPVRAERSGLLRPDPGRLGERQQVQPARRRPHRGPARVLRGGDGPVGDRRGHARPEPVAGGHRQRPAGHGLVHPLPAARLRDLRGGGRGRDQPRALRPPRGRVRAGGRLPHRVRRPEVRDVLPGRVHQHDHHLGARGDAVPGRLRRPAPARLAVADRSRSRACCSSSSGCAPRCRACATTA